jgi:hypothetical protein
MTSRAIAESYCMDLGSMAWASSETSSEFFRYWKNDKTCSERCLAEHLRFPILPRRKAGMVRALQAAGARTILPDMRGFGSSDKPREKAAYVKITAGPSPSS